MQRTSRNSHLRMLLGSLLLLSAGLAGAQPTSRQAKQALAVVKPVAACTTLAQQDLRSAVGAPVTLKAAEIGTAQGRFCHVTGTIAPSIGVEIDLPAEHWTQRLLQAGCGGLCGSINASIGNAGTCQPALHGEFVVAATDMGHQSDPMSGGPSFADDPQKRIDFAYRANHLTALAAKALIRTYYGQPQRYAYFSGCSDGGREAMMEAERFPDDFDGISAGAPAMYFQVQNSLNHAWTQAANTRADGMTILTGSKLAVLHTAVIDHCDTLDGIKDGLLSDPRACKVEPHWVLCTADVSDTSNCLTREEWAAASKLYEGPTDEQGRHFLPGGWQPGSELQWGGGAAGPPPAKQSNGTKQAEGVPKPRQGKGFAGAMLAAMAPVVFPEPTAADTNLANYPFTLAQFQRAQSLHGLNDAVSTNLRPFAKHGGKLLMYHGWSDTSIAPLITVAYFTALQKQMGAGRVDGFLKLFMIPGMGHCGGGDGFSQFDTLSPLMEWVENGRAPAMLIAGQLAPQRGMAAGPDGRGGKRQTAPYAAPDKAALKTRPIYPFPAIPHASGESISNWTDFKAASSDVQGNGLQRWIGSEWMNESALPDWTVKDGRLVQR